MTERRDLNQNNEQHQTWREENGFEIYLRDG